MLASLFVLSTPLSEMSARRLILVRHGAVSRQPRASWPDASQIPVKDGAFYGSNFDVPLSARGEAEIDVLPSRFDGPRRASRPRVERTATAVAFRRSSTRVEAKRRAYSGREN